MSLKTLNILSTLLGFSFSAALIFAASPSTTSPFTERDYQTLWCFRHKGQTEHVLHDQTRVDCLTDTHAVEFDWGHKWAEGIGQSLWYASQTKRRAGLALIKVDPSDERGIERAKAVIEEFKLPIDLWILDGN